MKAILLLLAGLVFLVTIFMSGVFFTAYVIAEPEPHKFAHIDTPDLWTAKPVEVKTESQSYERLPSVETVASVPASGPSGQGGVTEQKASNASPSAIDNTVTGSLEGQGALKQEAALGEPADRPGAEIDPAHAQWCSARYRSYSPEDDSYQPFSGGPRRQCEAPGMQMQQSASASLSDRPYSATNQAVEPEAYSQTVSDDGFQESAGSPQSDSHADWCLARYRSYRMQDNSYQPFDGGPRRACQSPFG